MKFVLMSYSGLLPGRSAIVDIVLSNRSLRALIVIVIILSVCCLSESCSAAENTDAQNSFLGQKVDFSGATEQDSTVNDFERLLNLGLIAEEEIPFLGAFMIQNIDRFLEAESGPGEFTWRELLREFDRYIGNTHHDYSHLYSDDPTLVDSIFTRLPSGRKIYVGQGPLSLEKLVERESKSIGSLDNRYSIGALDTRVDEFSASLILPAMIEDTVDFPFDVGVVFVIFRDSEQDLSQYSYGALQAITDNVRSSPEFQRIRWFMDKQSSDDDAHNSGTGHRHKNRYEKNKADTETGVRHTEASMLSDFDSGLSTARREGKSVLVYFTGFTVTNGRWLEKNIFPAPQVATLLNEKFVAIKLFTDCRSQKCIDNRELQKKLTGHLEIPHFLILGTEEEILAECGFMRTVEAFVEFLNNGLNRFREK